MLGTSTGPEIRQRIGYAIAAGVMASQLLTLFTTPVIASAIGWGATAISPPERKRQPARNNSAEPLAGDRDAV